MKQPDHKILEVLIVPTYNETLTLPLLLRDIIPKIKDSTAIIISDDSDKEHKFQILRIIKEFNDDSSVNILANNVSGKSGRGGAVHRAMKQALELFPNLQSVTEADVDGSHRVEDILRIIYSEEECDLLIGSRYLAESRITGWPKSRRIFSKILNITIPRLLGLKMRDVTNGLRRYSRRAAEVLSSREPINKGFIYLSEQAYIIKTNGMLIGEKAIHFIDRTVGESTVTLKEVKMSIFGVITLLIKKDR
jgi:dolichol-phosphate mannosyltransferase